MSETNGTLPRFTDEQVARLSNYIGECLAVNASTLRKQLASMMMDSRRDIEKETGVPSLGQPIDSLLLWHIFERDAIANKVVRLVPNEIWKVQPSVYEVEDADKVTAFEEAWDDLPRGLVNAGNMSYYQDEYGSKVWEALQRLEMMARIGRYAVLLLGLDDDRPLSEPAAGIQEMGSAGVEIEEEKDAQGKIVRRIKTNEAKGAYRLTVNRKETEDRKLTYLRVYPEHLAQISSLENNKRSPRYGQPTYYNITTLNPTDFGAGYGMSSGGFVGQTERVHWSRVIHRASDQITSSETFGLPTLWPLYDHIHALRKIYGGSGEGFWKAVLGILSLETHPSLGGDVQLRGRDGKTGEQTLKDDMEALINGLDRSILLKGMSLKSVAPTLVDPTAYKDIHLEAISICEDIPMRILKGSERGELSSEQDSGEWSGRLVGWRHNRTTPRTVCPFVDRMIMVGALPAPEATDKDMAKNALKYAERYSKKYEVKPAGGGFLIVNKATGKPKKYIANSGYSVWWPDPSSLSPEQEANIALVRTQALTTFMSGGGENGMTLQRFYTSIMGMEDEEAEAIVSEVEEKLLEEEEAAAEEAEEQMPQDGATDTVVSVEGQPAEQPAFPPQPSDNAFCPTGQGGGMDNSCSPGKGGGESSGSLLEKELSVDSVTKFANEAIAELKDSVQPGGKRETTKTIGKATTLMASKIKELSDASSSTKSKAILKAINDAKERLSTFMRVYNTQGQEPSDNAFCPTGQGGGMDNSCSPGKGGGAAKGMADLQSRVDEMLASTDAKLQSIGKGLDNAQQLANSDPDMFAMMANSTVGNIPVAAKGLADAVWKGAVAQQGMVSSALQDMGMSETASNAVGVLTAVLDNTVVPGPLSTIGACIMARVVVPGIIDNAREFRDLVRDTAVGARNLYSRITGNKEGSMVDINDPEVQRRLAEVMSGYQSDRDKIKLMVYLTVTLKEMDDLEAAIAQAEQAMAENEKV